MRYDYIPSKIYVDQSAIAHNLKIVQKLHPQKKILAVVKADAYGHGIENVCKPIIEAGASGFCVAYIDEARVIRELGINELILVLGACEVRAARIAQEKNISLTAPSLDWLKKATEFLDKSSSNRLRVHLAIDSGMGRIGMTEIEEVKATLNFIAKHQQLIELEGVFTHFATADVHDAYYEIQQKRFKQIVKELDLNVKFLHCENSAASLFEPEDNFTNALRLGIGLYGISPFESNEENTYQLKPALSLESEISYVKKVIAGTKISYGATYTAPDNEYIATVSIGYADGWLRRMKGFKLLVEGHYCPNVGRITMDQLMIRVPKFYPIGTKVTLIGSNDSKKITCEQVASYSETIPYEILTSFSKRIQRIAINPPKV